MKAGSAGANLAPNCFRLFFVVEGNWVKTSDAHVLVVD